MTNLSFKVGEAVSRFIDLLDEEMNKLSLCAFKQITVSVLRDHDMFIETLITKVTFTEALPPTSSAVPLVLTVTLTVSDELIYRVWANDRVDGQPALRSFAAHMLRELLFKLCSCTDEAPTTTRKLIRR